MKLYLIPATVDLLYGQANRHTLLWLLANYARGCGDHSAASQAEEWAREIEATLGNLKCTWEFPKSRFDPPTEHVARPGIVTIGGACLIETDRGRALELADGQTIIAVESSQIRGLSLTIDGCELVHEVREPKEEVNDKSATPRQDPN